MNGYPRVGSHLGYFYRSTVMVRSIRFRILQWNGIQFSGIEYRVDALGINSDLSYPYVLAGMTFAIVCRECFQEMTGILFFIELVQERDRQHHNLRYVRDVQILPASHLRRNFQARYRPRNHHR